MKSLRFRFAVAGLLFAPCVLAASSLGACSEEAPPSATSEDDLDSLDVANSWTDKANPANPDLAGPLWWPWSMTLTGPKYELFAVRSGRPSEPTALFAATGGTVTTGAFSLTQGAQGLLVLYKEIGSPVAGTALASAKLIGIDRATGATQFTKVLGPLLGGAPLDFTESGGWRRAYFSFDFPQAGDPALAGAAPPQLYQIVINNTAEKQVLRLGLVALHHAARPFYAIGHNPNSIERVDADLAAGANALEPDVRVTEGLGLPADGNVAVTEQSVILGKASDSNGQSTLTDYLRALKIKAANKLIIWDGKNKGTSDFAAMGRSIRQSAEREGFDLAHSVFNLSSSNMIPLYSAFTDLAKTGRCFDGIFTQVHSHTASEWMSPVRDNKLTFQGLGVDSKLQVTEKWSVPISVYVRAREQEDYPKKIYFWTVNDTDRMRRVLDLGIDGLISDNIPALLNLLKEEPYKSMYRLATDADDTAAKHGGEHWYRPR